MRVRHVRAISSVFGPVSSASSRRQVHLDHVAFDDVGRDANVRRQDEVVAAVSKSDVAFERDTVHRPRDRPALASPRVFLAGHRFGREVWPYIARIERHIYRVDAFVADVDLGAKSLIRHPVKT
jgi:hypothetical protein